MQQKTLIDVVITLTGYISFIVAEYFLSMVVVNAIATVPNPSLIIVFLLVPFVWSTYVCSQYAIDVVKIYCNSRKRNKNR